MTDEPISPLHRRMIEDMTVRGFTASTQREYIRAVKDFTAFLDRSPDQARAEDLRRFQLHIRSAGASATTMNAAVSALRFFFGVTLGRGDAEVGMTTVSGAARNARRHLPRSPQSSRARPSTRSPLLPSWSGPSGGARCSRRGLGGTTTKRWSHASSAASPTSCRQISSTSCWKLSSALRNSTRAMRSGSRAFDIARHVRCWPRASTEVGPNV